MQQEDPEYPILDMALAKHNMFKLDLPNGFRQEIEKGFGLTIKYSNFSNELPGKQSKNALLATFGCSC
jgi:hypothetical protein